MNDSPHCIFRAFKYRGPGQRPRLGDGRGRAIRGAKDRRASRCSRKSAGPGLISAITWPFCAVVRRAERSSAPWSGAMPQSGDRPDLALADGAVTRTSSRSLQYWTRLGSLSSRAHQFRVPALLKMCAQPQCASMERNVTFALSVLSVWAYVSSWHNDGVHQPHRQRHIRCGNH